MYQPFSFLVALATVIVIAALKEIIDKLYGKGQCEWYDFTFTVSGALIAFCVKKKISSTNLSFCLYC